MLPPPHDVRANLQVKRLRGLAVDQDLRIRVQVIDIDEIVLVECGLKLLHEKLRILHADAEHELEPTLPKTASLIFSSSWAMNWCAIVRFKRYLRASDKIVADGIRRKVLELIYI